MALLPLVLLPHKVRTRLNGVPILIGQIVGWSTSFRRLGGSWANIKKFISFRACPDTAGRLGGS